MTVVAISLARIVEDPLATLNRGRIGLLLLKGQQVSGDIVDLARREGYHRIQVVGMSGGERRHVGEIPTPGIPGANTVENDALYLTHSTCAVEPVVVGEVRDSERGVA